MTDKLVEYKDLLLNTHNIILHGVPGTGKTYSAKEIAAKIVTGDNNKTYDDLSLEEKACIELVQFHPNYDYTDFVEGIRPVWSSQEGQEGQVGFELKDGVFKRFLNLTDYIGIKLDEITEDKMKEILKRFISEKVELTLIEGNKHVLEEWTEKNGKFRVTYTKSKSLKLERIMALLRDSGIQNSKKEKENEYVTEDDKTITPSPYIRSVINSSEVKGLHGSNAELNHYYAIITKLIDLSKLNRVFIIDEINRGEISKIFGELFSLLESDYRGPEHAIALQYQNLYPEDKQHEKFYIPKNVYIIGTMNDIDRSVDTFDFAMRRRFSFIEITPEDSAEAMLDEKTKVKFSALNTLIKDKLGDEYQLGASYFKDLKDLNEELEEIWEYKVKPLLSEYSRGILDKEQFEELVKDCRQSLQLSDKSNNQ